VYAVDVLAGAVRGGGIANIGVRPTVTDGTAETVEVHIFDTAADLYGSTVRMGFIGRLRDERKFAGPAELVAQLGDDEQRARALLARAGRSTM
jgi:riboflavin kinase/FMN adenylyltransferase